MDTLKSMIVRFRTLVRAFKLLLCSDRMVGP
jgi:hypothetical protein